MNSERLRMGVIGAGFMGAKQAKIWNELPNTKLVAIADPDETAGQTVASRLGADYHQDAVALLARADIDAVSIVSPDRLHLEPATAAAQAGKHILLEKPMAHTTEAAVEIAKAAEDSGVRLMIGHLARFDPRYTQLYAAADPDKLGEPIHLRAKRNTVRSTANRLGTHSSILYYLGVHDIDLMQWIARSPIIRVYGQKVEKLSSGNENVIYAVVNFANGAIGSLDYSWAWPDGLPGGFNAAFEVVGTKAAAFIDVRDQGFHIVTNEGPVASDTFLWPETNGKVTGILRDELLHFAQAIQSDTPFVQDYREALDAVRVLDALFTSVESGTPAEVDRP